MGGIPLRQPLAGKNLRPEAPALAASSASVGVKTPGIVALPRAQAAGNDIGIDVGSYQQPAANVMEPLDSFQRVQNSARTNRARRTLLARI